MPGYPSRCQHLKVNGTQCGSPALRRNRFCFFHKRFQDERIRLNTDRARRGVATFELPVLEDANSIQIALMQVMRLLVAQQIDHRTASLLLYALQTASSNLRMTKFDPWRHDVVLDPRDVAATPLDSHLWADEDFEDEDDEEEESAADRAIAALAEERKKKREHAKWMRWAEAKYPDPNRQAQPSAAVTAAGSAVVAPATAQKRPPAKAPINHESDDVSRIRQEIGKAIVESGVLGSSLPKKKEDSGA